MFSRVEWGGFAALMLVALHAFANPVPARADGGDIAYIANDSHSVHLVRPDGSSDRQLFSSTSYVANIAWSPGGELLAYTILGETSARGTRRIYLYDLSSGGTSELKSTMGTTGPVAFFPNGKQLVAMDDQNHPPLGCAGQTVVIELASGKAAPLVKASACFLAGLQVAPDGKALITSSCTPAPGCTVLNVSLESGETTTISEPSDAPFSVSGVVAPDNQRVAYIAHHTFDVQAATTDLVLADRDGSNQHVVWQGPLGTVSFAPDSKQVAVTLLSGNPSDVERNEDIWLLGLDGNDPLQIAAGHNPVWRPSQGAAEAPTNTAPPPDVTVDASPSDPVIPTVPNTLTDSIRADILSAVDRANAAWASASQSLDPSGLSEAVAGRELTNDQAELDKLRSQGHTRKNINTAFSVTQVTLDAPGHAIVRTLETWYAEIYDARSGRLLQRLPSTTYAETYTVEHVNGAWIVTQNDV